MIKMTEFAKRRKQLMQTIGRHSIVILSSAPSVIRNQDCEYPYRQNSDFYYLTGFEEPEAVIVLIPKHKNGEFILFNRPRDRDKEIWDGYRAGQEDACTFFGADQAFPIADFENMLPELLSGREAVHFQMGANQQFDLMIEKGIDKIRSKIRHGIQSPLTLVDISHTIHEMRLIKSSAEIALMKKAATISAKAHKRAMQFCQPGKNEYALEAEILHEFHRHGARFPAYNSIVGSGKNSCILHYINNNQTIQTGDIVLVDAGCEYFNYASDITRTFPANGKFTAEQKAIYEVVLAAQLAAIKSIKPGSPWPTAQNIIVKIITQGLLDLGILRGNLTTLIEKQAYLPFYMHKSGHWLGLDVHDVGRYRIHHTWRNLTTNMVLTIEPGIYISANIPGVHKRWHNIGIRIEDDVQVTDHSHEVLSAAAPKTISDIETLMN